MNYCLAFCGLYAAGGVGTFIYCQRHKGSPEYAEIDEALGCVAAALWPLFWLDRLLGD